MSFFFPGPSTSLGESPGHSFLHRVVAIDNGAAALTIGITASEITMNAISANTDFRVKGVTDNSLFFADASTDYIGVGTNSPTSKFTVIKTSAAAFGGDAAIFADYQYAIGASQVPAAITGQMTNTGSTALSGGAHGIGGLFRAFDTVNGKIPMIGLEGRVDGAGSQAIQYQAMNVNALWTDSNAGNTTTFNGTLISAIAQRYVYNNNGSTPRLQGSLFGFYVADAVGGLLNYGIFVAAQTGSSVNVSCRIDSGSTYTLQLCGESDPTTAAGGITFGASADTRLYRSAASTLTTTGVMIASLFQTSTAPTANSSGTVAIVGKTASTGVNNAGWLPMKRSDGTTVYMPYWT